MFWSFSSGSTTQQQSLVEYYLHWTPRFDMSKQAFIYMRVINLRLYFFKGNMIRKLTLLFFSLIRKIIENCRVTSLTDFCFLVSS
jgi:hypothetical protein